MREILFRAKRISDGEWVEGSYVYCKGATTVSFQNEHYILVFDGFGVEWVAIDKDTICQYTGLTDKDGNKIWENDIVNIDSYSYMEPEDSVCGIVRYSNAYSAYCLDCDGKNGWILIYDCAGSYTTIYQVIGNTIDNPELLKGGI